MVPAAYIDLLLLQDSGSYIIMHNRKSLGKIMMSLLEVSNVLNH